jgi:putative phage-type endonuclease
MQIRDDSVTIGAQQSAQWFQDRIGKLTASAMSMAMDFTAKGAEGAKRKQLKIDILAERMTDIIREVYVTPAMQHGTDTEPAAKLAYEAATGAKVMPAPFVPHPTIENFGASPDGMIHPDGLLEVKCPTTSKFIAWKLAGVVPDEHKPQMLAQLACTRRKWVEFVAFDPRMPEGKRLFIRRYEPTTEEVAAVEKAAETFLAEVDEMFDQVVTAA